MKFGIFQFSNIRGQNNLTVCTQYVLFAFYVSVKKSGGPERKTTAQTESIPLSPQGFTDYFFENFFIDEREREKILRDLNSFI